MKGIGEILDPGHCLHLPAAETGMDIIVLGGRSAIAVMEWVTSPENAPTTRVEADQMTVVVMVEEVQ